MELSCLVSKCILSNLSCLRVGYGINFLIVYELNVGKIGKLGFKNL